jgi:hypothetical protein
MNAYLTADHCCLILLSQFIMSDKELKELEDLVERKKKESLSKEEALRSLQRAGILDSNGHYTAPYQELNKLSQR